MNCALRHIGCNSIHGGGGTLTRNHGEANIDSICAQYDKVVLPKAESPKSRKKAIAMRNKWAVKHADHVMFYTNFEDSPAYEAFEYAEELEVEKFNFDFTLSEGDLQRYASVYRKHSSEGDF